MSSTVIGAVVLSRHGDRSGFYQSPDSYTAKDTTITPLGEQQEFQLGQTLASIYLDETSPTFISQLSSEVVNKTRVSFMADAGGEGTVILDSAAALAQGMWPANDARNTTLANGTTITSPLGGYQYIGVESIEAAQSPSLEGWTDCEAFTKATKELYASDLFSQKSHEVSDFLQSLTPIVNGRNVSLSNFYNVFDYINVQSIHNETFLDTVNDQILAQSRDLANWHEWNVFTSDDLGGISNIAGRTILPTVFDYLNTMSNLSQPLRFAELSISYKPFISLTKMLGLSDENPALQGMVNYAGSMTFELHQPESSTQEAFVRLGVKNGTEEAGYTYYNMLDTENITLSKLQSSMSGYTLNDLSSWCHACGNTDSRGCQTIAAANETWSNNAVADGQSLSPLAAGFIGASVTFAVLVALFAGFLAKQSTKRRKQASNFAAAGGVKDSSSSNTSINEK